MCKIYCGEHDGFSVVKYILLYVFYILWFIIGSPIHAFNKLIDYNHETHESNK